MVDQEGCVHAGPQRGSRRLWTAYSFVCRLVSTHHLMRLAACLVTSGRETIQLAYSSVTGGVVCTKQN